MAASANQIIYLVALDTRTTSLEAYDTRVARLIVYDTRASDNIDG